MKTRHRIELRITVGVVLFLAVVTLSLFSNPPIFPVFAQQPTGSIATVTGTPEGPRVIVYSDQDIIGVYAGPSAYLYPQVGILLAGEKAPALGFSADLEWIQIIYLGVSSGTGWIYAPFVSLIEGSFLPVLPNPPTATPRTTPTIDPTQAALYGLELTPERLATFTPPVPLELPEFEVTGEARPGLPMGLIILLLALIGVLGAVISFLRGR